MFCRRGDAALELYNLIGRAMALALRGHQELVSENLAVRQQLAAVKRTDKRSPVAERQITARESDTGCAARSRA